MIQCWEKVKEVNPKTNIKENILKKLNLCQKLKNYFEEDKLEQKFDSLETLTTSLMISAKIFENEENVKTFKKHEKVCQVPMEDLKKIELNLMRFKKWELQHFCIYDFSLFVFTQKLFCADDLIETSNVSLNLNKIFRTKFENLLNEFGDKFGDHFLNKNLFKKVQIIKNLDFKKKNLFREFKIYFFEGLKLILQNFVLKSDFKFLFCIILCLFTKEILFGADYIVFKNFNEELLNIIQK